MQEDIGQNCAPSRQEKHIALHEAIQSIGSVISSLDNLIERIEGPTLKAGEDINCNKEPLPSFENVLNNGPDEIRRLTDEAHKRIEQIGTLLF